MLLTQSRRPDYLRVLRRDIPLYYPMIVA